jgi:hypothetical protein
MFHTYVVRICFKCFICFSLINVTATVFMLQAVSVLSGSCIYFSGYTLCCKYMFKINVCYKCFI